MSEPIKLSKQVKQDLKGVVALMEANIDRIDMSSWIYKRSKADTPKGTSCGTVGCIAGYINLYHGYKEIFFDGYKNWDECKISAKATKIAPERAPRYASPASVATILMGLKDDDDLNPLFHTDSWPQPFKSKYEALEDESGDGSPAEGNHIKAGKLAISRFKHFIKTGL